MQTRIRLGDVSFPKGIQPIAGGRAQRHHRTAASPHPSIPEGLQPSHHGIGQSGWNPSGIQSALDSRDRWCRCARPPAMGCDPSGVGSCVDTNGVGREAFAHWRYPSGPLSPAKASSRSIQPIAGERGQALAVPDFSDAHTCRGSRSGRGLPVMPPLGAATAAAARTLRGC